MFEALATILATALSKGIPVLLSVGGLIDRQQISEFLAATAVMQIFILGVGLGQTASLTIDFFKGKLLRHIVLSVGIIGVLILSQKKDPQLVIIAWACACAQLAYQFIENRMKLLSLYVLGRQAAIYMLLAVVITAALCSRSVYYRLIIQYLPIVVFSVYALYRYYQAAEHNSDEDLQGGRRSFDYVLCVYAFCSTFSLVIERQFYVAVGGSLMEAYFWAINVTMILTFVQDYLVKSRFFDDAKYEHYGWVIVGLGFVTGLTSLFMHSTIISIVICLLLLYLAQNAFFSMYVKTRQIGVAVIMGTALAMISLTYYLVTSMYPSKIVLVSGVQWLSATLIGVAMVLYSRKGFARARA
jgi:hypothetical protein